MHKTLLIISLLIVSQFVFAQLSPGELAKPHAHLEGISNCTKCHLFGEKVGNNKCLDCHTLLKSRIEQNLGYHASSDIKGKQCVECHSDHHGRKFEMIRFEQNTFNHDLTGYKLEGAHSRTDCNECHQKKNIYNTEIAKKTYTYMGLNNSCLSCHDDVHRQTLSNNCTDCHNNEQFVPASKFKHETTSFPLLGKHQQVDCEKCHSVEQIEGKKFQRFAGIKFNRCTDCHEDVHNNKFGQDCRKCHTVNSFRNISSLENFDHSTADFKLQGKHKNVDCKSCHKGSYTQTIAHNKCSNCHTDFHEGQLAMNHTSPDCKICHTVNGFSPSTYSINDHENARFKLKGAHMATPCFACHQKEDKWQFKLIGETCVDCHTDIHENLIAKKYYPNQNCEACHSVNRWSEINFDHNKTRFELLGAHQLQSCRSCHFQPEASKTIQKFKEFDKDCLSCHQDEHQNQFEARGKTDCLRCHTNEDWNISHFNHDNTAFKLEGRHAELDCAACHKTIQVNQIAYKQYKFEDFSCATCH